MNRSLPALILLLGTLGGSIVALGVARDLERIGRRPAAETHHASTVYGVSFHGSRSTPDVTIRSHYVADAIAYLDDTLLREATLVVRQSSDWALAYSNAPIDAIELLKTSLLKEATSIVRQSSDWADRALAYRSTSIDALIAANDGIVEKDERDRVPYGYVAIGPDRTLVALKYRGDGFADAFTWTGALHYGASPRQTLGSTLVNNTPVAKRAQPLPWDQLLLWSGDRRTLTTRWNRLVLGVVQTSATSIEYTGRGLDGLAWIDRQVSRSWESMTIHVKRELWLVTVPQLPGALRSAELPQGDKR